jgi:CheY-like chemotaxis protein
VLVEILEDEGYRVSTATNGMEALTYLRQEVDRPSLILLDLGMPVMTGWEFREEQLGDATLADIPVVVLSATIDLQSKAAALQVAGCLDKPVTIDALLSMVEQYVS